MLYVEYFLKSCFIERDIQSINQGLFCIQTNNNNNIHTFVSMNTERAGNEVLLLI